MVETESDAGGENGASQGLVSGADSWRSPSIGLPPSIRPALKRQRGRSSFQETKAPKRVLPRKLGSAFRRIAKYSHGKLNSGNALILGENLTVLDEIRSRFEGQVKCVYIDPPYNNQENYKHYQDSESHDAWLLQITQRLEALKPLLANDGSIWISIDDREVHYLKVAADKIFGRSNFLTTIIWQQRTTRENRKAFSNNHEYILVYSVDSKAFRQSRNQLPASKELLARYKNPDNDPRGSWQSITANVQDGHGTPSQFYSFVAPNGRTHSPPQGRCWVYSKNRMVEEIAAGNIWFGKNGNGVPRIKRFLQTTKLGLTPETLWGAAEVGTNDLAKKQMLELFPGEAIFDTPKPEDLVARIVEIATNKGDLVLDAYLGSGTTAAVAHKLNRRFVGIEVGQQAISHCAARLKMVVDGEGTGVSSRLRWEGGGGFDFYRLLKKR